MQRATASGSSPFTWRIGAGSILATLVAYMVERPSRGRRGEADLVVDHDVHRAADAVARQAAQVQRLLHHAFANECGVAVDQQAHDLRAIAVLAAVLLGARTRPSTTGLTNSRWLGLKQSDRCTRWPAAVR